MPEAEPFLVFTEALNRLGLRYMVSGSIAATYYGEPRVTHDIDIVLVLKGEGIEAFAAAFPLDDFYCPPIDIIRIEQRREERGHFNLIHHATGFKADLYLAKRDLLHQWGLDHVKFISLGEARIPLAPPEYVIVRKLQFYREGKAEKHLRDVSRMLTSLGEEWDRRTLLRWVEQLAVRAEWGLALAAEE
jgi:hypothetical protein